MFLNDCKTPLYNYETTFSSVSHLFFFFLTSGEVNLNSNQDGHHTFAIVYFYALAKH